MTVGAYLFPGTLCGIHNKYHAQRPENDEGVHRPVVPDTGGNNGA